MRKSRSRSPVHLQRGSILFQKGAALGDPDSMMSLADQIGKGQARGDMISLYQRPAKLGHPGAKRALEALAQERTPPRLIFRFPF